ncbi:hypothetical protein ABEV00_00555 [Paenibacillus thiaminolyticus]
MKSIYRRKRLYFVHKIIIRFLKEKVDIVFSSVFAHYFEPEISGSIILNIEKGDLIDFLKDNKELLTQGYEYSWPSDYNTTEELMEKLEIEGYSYYIINSSYGLNGWVLAKESYVFVGD